MLKINDSASAKKTITTEMINAFAGLSEDYNPVHMDEEIASRSVFGKRIAHGLLTSSLISGVLGTKLPGTGTIYLEQNLKFKKPVYIGDEIEAVVTVKEMINKDKGIYKLDTSCVNQDNEIVVEGYAIVKYMG